MEESGDLREHTVQLNQKASDLLCVDFKLEDEDKTIIFIYLSSSSFNNLTTVLMFGKRTLDYEEVVLVLKFHLIMQKLDTKNS